MGKPIIKIKDKYFIWSTVVDAPITMGMNHDELFDWLLQEYGRNGTSDFNDRMKRVEATGTSCLISGDLKTLLAHNKAGLDETCLSKEQIYEQYNDFKNP